MVTKVKIALLRAKFQRLSEANKDLALLLAEGLSKHAAKHAGSAKKSRSRRPRHRPEARPPPGVDF